VVTASSSPVALRSARWHGFFHAAFRRRARMGLRAVRLACWGKPVALPGPLVVFANHPSWWDGVAFMLLSTALFPGRVMYVPMAAEALARYPFMRRLGVFGVEPGTARGAVILQRIAGEVLATPGAMLWLNAPGRFMDPRERPVPLIPGLARLPELAPEASFLPLALDYPFWGEAKPEMLAGFGPPIPAAALLTRDRATRSEALAAALTSTMDRLAADAISRDPALFTTLVQGRQGMGGTYQGWQRLRALWRGERFDPRHERHPEPS
jgi:1-acyl-sn-glycerol-3-phosphate acyltransferase